VIALNVIGWDRWGEYLNQERVRCDKWAEGSKVSRSEAIRELIERGLAPAATKSRRPAKRKGEP
jgi:hypothetical protein